MQIKVRLVRTSRDGWILKWSQDGITRQAKCAGKTNRARESERRRKEDEVNDRSNDLQWVDYWDHFSTNYLSGMSPAHAAKCRTMQARLTDAASRLGIRKLRCGDINAAVLLEVESELRRIGNRPATIKSNMDTLWSILTWGQEFGLIPPIARPKRRRGKKAKQGRKSKGRPLTLEEIERMAMAIPLSCKSYEDADSFVRAFHGMRLFGFRLSECWNFSWEPSETAHYPIRLDRTNPAVVFSDLQKSGESEEVPMTPEAAAWLRSLNQDGQWICRTYGPKGEHKTPNRLGRVVAAAGRRARIVVKRYSETKVKYASCHDLRRTFAQSLYSKLNVSELQRMTRHSDVSTLLNYYADVSTPDLVNKLNSMSSGGLSGGLENVESS